MLTKHVLQAMLIYLLSTVTPPFSPLKTYLNVNGRLFLRMEDREEEIPLGIM